MLDDLGGFINSFDLFTVFSILLDPGVVLLFSQSFFLGEGLLVNFNIFGGNSDFFFSFSKSVGGVFLELGGGDNTGFVVLDFLFHITDEFLT